MATYNGEKHIKEQVLSILNQKFVNFPETSLELIISDDNSTDHTIEVVSALDDSRIHIIPHKKNTYKYYNALISATKNFENSIARSTGDYIFLSDQDDIWYPNKLDTMLKTLQKKTCCVHSFDWINQHNEHLGNDIFPEKPEKPLSLMKRFPYYGFCFGFDKNFKNKILPFPLIPQHDIFIGLIAALKGELAICPEILCAHRKYINELTGVNVSDSGFKEPVIVKIFYRLKLIFFALARSLK
jgi:glycosyltransferase involved in cell wall biosynthesis